MKVVAGELNKLTDSMADSLNDFPPGEPCEWPIEVDEDGQQADDTTTDSDIDEAGDVVCEGDVDDGSSINSELVDESLIAPEGEPAVEIVALTEEACGEGGVVGLREVDAAELLAMEKAQSLYYRALTTAKDSYVEASQHRARLQAEVKEAKEEEAERLEAIDSIEARGWHYFLPSKKPAAAPVSAPSTDGPLIPSHESTLPPPQPEHSAESPLSPQAGVSGASDQAPPASGFRDDWESVDIAALNLKPSLATLLREAGYDTIGKLEALRGKFEGLLSIDGVGRAKADAIEDALLGWLSKNRDAAVLSAAKEKAVAGEGLALEMAAQGQD